MIRRAGEAEAKEAGLIDSATEAKEAAGLIDSATEAGLTTRRGRQRRWPGDSARQAKEAGYSASQSASRSKEAGLIDSASEARWATWQRSERLSQCRLRRRGTSARGQRASGSGRRGEKLTFCTNCQGRTRAESRISRRMAAKVRIVTRAGEQTAASSPSEPQLRERAERGDRKQTADCNSAQRRAQADSGQRRCERTSGCLTVVCVSCASARCVRDCASAPSRARARARMPAPTRVVPGVRARVWRACVALARAHVGLCAPVYG